MDSSQHAFAGPGWSLQAGQAEAQFGLQVHVRVKIPSQPTKEEKDLVEQLRELEAKKKDGGGFFSKFKL